MMFLHYFDAEATLLTFTVQAIVITIINYDCKTFTMQATEYACLTVPNALAYFVEE
jgi:hypothetical protein